MRRTLPLLLVGALAGCQGGPALEDLEILDNPNNVLSCFVRWTTAEPATSRVEFGMGEELRFFVEDDAPVTEHELMVFGLHETSDVLLQAVSVDGEGQEGRSEDLLYETAALPFPGVVIDTPILREEAAQPGWTLTNIAIAETLSPIIVVMLDLEGEIVWYHHMGPIEGRADVEATYLEDGTVLVGGGVPPGMRPVRVDLAGQVLWEGPLQPAGLLENGMMHHTLKALPDGRYLGLFNEIVTDDGVHINDVIHRFDADLQIDWSWRTWDHQDVLGETYPQGNMARLDPDAGFALYGGRYISQVFKIDVATGDVIWTLGEGGDFQMQGDHEYPWFAEQHDPEFLPNGNLLLYDNGHIDREFCRVLELKLDEQQMTASIEWEYPGELAEDSWFNTAWGDADRLDNGNTLVVSGNMFELGTRSHMFEVTAEGQKVWEIWFEAEEGDKKAGAYMAQRIPVLVGEL